MIERWHRSLKTTIKCHKFQEWSYVLPTVLLSLRTTVKEDINASAADMVYGITFGYIFLEEETPIKQTTFLKGLRNLFSRILRQAMQSIKPRNTTHHTKTKLFIHPDLLTTLMFL